MVVCTHRLNLRSLLIETLFELWIAQPNFAWIVFLQLNILVFNRLTEIAGKSCFLSEICPQFQLEISVINPGNESILTESVKEKLKRFWRVSVNLAFHKGRYSLYKDCFNNLDQFGRLKGHIQHVQNAHHETGVLNYKMDTKFIHFSIWLQRSHWEINNL